MDKTAALHKDYVLEPSQDAAVERYGAVQEDFLWISNIWSPDVPWRDAILDYNNFVSNISDYSNFDEVVDELDAKVDGEFVEVYCGHCINLKNKEKCGYKKANETCKLFNCNENNRY